MKFNIPFKKKFNVWHRKFAWLPKRMADNPNVVVWLGFYWSAWLCYYRVVYYIPKGFLTTTSTDTSSKAYYPASMFSNMVSSTG